MQEIDYNSWVAYSRTTEEEAGAMERQISGFEYLPSISVALVLHDPDEVWIKSSVDSVLRQIYPYLELCVLDNGSQRSHVSEVLQDYALLDDRVRVRRLSERKSRAGMYNASLAMATGEFVALLEGGDELAPTAIFKVVELLQRTRADVVYTDEDHLDVGSRRFDPVFKPYWSPELLLSSAYVGRLCVTRRSILETPDVFREGFEGAEEHDLILRLSEKTGRIHHLPEVLYHRRRLPVASDPGVDRAGQASSRAVSEALARRGEDATVEPDPVRGSLQLVRRRPGSPRVSAIVLAPGGMVDAPFVDELEHKTSLPLHQVTVASTEGAAPTSPDRVFHPSPARALNLAAGRSDGEYLVFVDGRAQVTAAGWLSELLGQARRRDVGAVGCRLLNPDGSLRHGGSLIEVGRLVGPLDDLVFDHERPPPLVDRAFNFAAATVECMVVRKAVFDEAGGFDDEKLPASFYDLDLSFRIRETGLLNIYTPHASLICANPGTLPGEGEIEYMWRRWWERLVELLYYRWSPLYTAYRELGGRRRP